MTKIRGSALASWTSWAKIGTLAALCVVLVLTSLPVMAQERYGSITGVATDPSGAVLSDVNVTITNQSTNRTLTTKTRNDGTFAIQDLDPGRYTVSFEKQGFTKHEVRDASVLLGRSTNLTAQMKVGGVDQTVEVSGEAPAVDTTSTMVATNVTAEEIDRLPKARNFTAIANLAPSVNTGTIEGGFQINGASAAENAYYIDGVSTNSVIDGSARQNATFDYLQEVQVKTTGLDAEYGGALGGVVTAVTKSGGNAFHGDVHYYYYGNKLNAGPAKRLVLNPFTESTPTPEARYFQDDKFLRDNHELGGSLGGPIVKNHVFFYTAFSPRWLNRRQDYMFTETDPSGNPFYTPGNMSRTFRQMNWFNKISIEPTSRLRMNFSYLYTPQYQRGQLYGYDGFMPNGSTASSENAALDVNRGFAQSENSVTGQIDYTISNSTLVSVKGGRYFLNFKENGVPATGSYLWQSASVDENGVPVFPGMNPDWLRPAGYSTPSGARTAHDLTTRTYVQADFTQAAKLLGRHGFKFGVGTQKNVNNVEDLWFGEQGRVELYWNSGCTLAACSVAARGPYGYYVVQEGGTIGSTGSNITHLYVQDAYQPFSRLTVNVGVRFEKETIPSFQPEVQKYAIKFGYGDKVAPRVGASYDLFGNGKVKISAGWGRYYDWTKYDVARGTFGADVWHTYYRTLDSLDATYLSSINLQNMPGTNLLAGQFRNRRVPGFQYLDPNVKPMSADSLNAGVEWEVAKNFVFAGRYVRNKLNRTIEDMGALDANGDEVYRYGNPGEGANVVIPASGDTCEVQVAGVCGVPMPKAKRVYDAMELSLSKRFGQGWLANFSYVYSKLYGNYSGLQSTDEIRPTTLGGGYAGNQQAGANIYRSGGNANRYFDLDEALYDAQGRLGLEGRLPTDRPHVFKFYGSKTFAFGTDIGGFFRVMSGTPITTQVMTTNSIPFYVNGRGDMGRTPVFNQTDLVVGHSFKVGEGKALRVEMNMLNIFNQKTEMFRFDRYINEDHETSSGMDLSGTNLAAGFDWQALLAAQAAGRATAGEGFGWIDRDPRYGMATEFNTGFEGRLMIKYTF